MSLGGQAAAGTVAHIMANKLRELIAKAEQAGNVEAMALLRDALEKAESIAAHADSGWW